MAVLLDTHAFLWWCSDSEKLSEHARKTIAVEDCFVSVASMWEMAIKVSLGKLRLQPSYTRYTLDQIFLNGFTELPIEFRHVAHSASLPWVHRDPFDRILIAQSMVSHLPLVSNEAVFDDYGVTRIW